MLEINFVSTITPNSDLMDIEEFEGMLFNMPNEDADFGGYEINIDIMASDIDTSDAPQKIGELKFYAYGTWQNSLNVAAKTFASFDRHGNLDYAMDCTSGDTAGYYEVLRKMYSKIRTDEDILDEVFIVAFDRFFIEPAYRGKRIGTYVMKNLTKILYNYARIIPLYIVEIINPDDKTKETEDIQVKTMKSAGMILAKNSDKKNIFAACLYDEWAY